MSKIVEKNDIPKENLSGKIDDYKFQGAVVSVISQEDGRFTIRAFFSDNPANLEQVVSNGNENDSPWLAVAKKELALDVKEIQGVDNNSRIVAYHATTSLSANDDETPWCSSFVNFCMEEAGVQGTGSATARSWENWGKKLDNPILGCVIVLERPAGGTNAGHVGFYLNEQNNKFFLLGGNQGDKVCIVPFEKSRIIAYRWPA